ncbi:YdcH family protein [Lysobacter xanthus]
MFEERSANELDSLLKSNPEFKQLYQQHKELDRRVMNAELGINPVDDLELTRMKREKLAAKDRLVRLAGTVTH